MTKQNAALFQPYTFKKGITVNNSIAMAPTTTGNRNIPIEISCPSDLMREAHMSQIDYTVELKN